VGASETALFSRLANSQARGWRYHRELLAGEKEENLWSIGSFKLWRQLAL